MTACHAHAPRAPRTRQTTETGTQSAGWSPLSGCRSWEEGGESGVAVACATAAPSAAVSFSVVSVTRSQMGSENITWKIPDRNNLPVLSCSLF